jgi:iron complex transport system ATP-binding protein
VSTLSARDLAIGYGAPLARGIALDLTQGSVTCLLGPNGAGKTTLFRTLLGFIPALSGAIHVAGEDIATVPRARLARHLAYVPQAQPGGFAYTVLDLVVMGRTSHIGAFGTPARTDLDRAIVALETLGIADLATRDITRISGGQRQLALIARALAQEARIIVMDEPTASLDLGNRLLVLAQIRRLAAEGLAVLMSTHEPEQVFEVASQVATLDQNGHFETGTPGSLLTSARLSRLYGLALEVERTTSGRIVVSRGLAE